MHLLYTNWHNIPQFKPKVSRHCTLNKHNNLHEDTGFDTDTSMGYIIGLTIFKQFNLT